jgi:peroxiredoxin (alkyl hydroperoxide reductase subunit C)
MAAVAAKAEELKRLETELIAISIDTVFVHRVWQEVELSKLIPGGFPFPMGSDLSGKVGSLYGVYDEKAGINLRGTFLIDPDGIIRVVQIYDAPIGRNFEELVRMIEAAKQVRASQGMEACPANWKPGKDTLKPSPELAGKVHQTWNPSELDN